MSQNTAAFPKKILKFGAGWVVYVLQPCVRVEESYWNAVCEVHFTYLLPDDVSQIKVLSKSDEYVYLGLIELNPYIPELNPEKVKLFFENELEYRWSTLEIMNMGTIYQSWVINLPYLEELSNFRLKHLFELNLDLATAYNYLDRYIREEIIQSLKAAELLADIEGWDYTPLAKIREKIFTDTLISQIKREPKSTAVSQKIVFLDESYTTLWQEFWQSQNLPFPELNQPLPLLPRPQSQYILLLRRHLETIRTLKRTSQILELTEVK